MKDQIEDAMRRTRRYWNIDGLSELGFGLICLLLGGYFFIQSTLQADTLFAQVLNIVFILIVVGGSLVSNRLVSYLKKKYTYPRTGYVNYRQPPRSRRLILSLVAGAISALLVALLSITDFRSFWMPITTALIVAVVFTYVAYQGYAVRYYFLALCSLAFGVGVALAGLQEVQGLAIYYGGMGLVQLLLGGIVFRNFLAANSPAEEDEP